MADTGPYLLRYVAGEHAHAWAQLSALGEGVREPTVFDGAWAVALETMRRVRRNLVTIHQRLLDSGYRFAVPEHSLVEPAATAASLLAQIEREYRVLPLSLRAFYEVVGSVDFRQSWHQRIQWSSPDRATAPELALLDEQDPLVVAPLEELVAVCRSGLSRVTFFFAPDEFHKAGYSGGENYHLTLPNANADFCILGMYGLDEPFVEHLRASLAS